MKDNLTAIAVIIDRSGSMGTLMTDVVGGFNEFVKQQKELPGEATLTLVQFDNVYEVLHDFVDIQKVPKLTSEVCYARNSTALLDAIGVTINTVGQKIAAMPEDQRPAKVLVSIYTDGQENSSHEFKLAKIKEMIATQRKKYNWEFTFTGVGEDSLAEDQARGMGIDMNLVMQMSHDSKGTSEAMDLCSKGVTSYRGGGADALRSAYKNFKP